jgi:phosphoribosylanthranilate isomerase
MPRMLLVDAAHGGQFGGTGKTLDWSQLAQHRSRLGGVPLVLAGGLAPENVACAIAQVRPWAVDVASGVETAPGVKSPERVREFIAAARKALQQAARR